MSQSSAKGAAHTHVESDVTDLAHTDTAAIHDDTANEITAVTIKGTPVDADEILIEDSAASFVKKAITLGTLPSHTPAAHTIDSHSDTTGTGAELNELTDASETTLHSHAAGGGGSGDEQGKTNSLDTPCLNWTGKKRNSPGFPSGVTKRQNNGNMVTLPLASLGLSGLSHPRRKKGIHLPMRRGRQTTTCPGGTVVWFSNIQRKTPMMQKKKMTFCIISVFELVTP